MTDPVPTQQSPPSALTAGGEPVRVMRIIARLNVGGPARHVVLLEQGLGARGYETRLVTGPVGWDEGDMSYLARERGVEPVFLPSLRRAPTPLHDVRALRDVYRLIREYRPHIVHTHTAKAGGIGRLAAALGRVPIRLHTFHGHVLHGYFPRIVSGAFLQAERFLARLSDRIVTISARQRHEIAEIYRVAHPDKVVEVPLGIEIGRLRIDRAAVASRRRELGIGEEESVIGWVGRLVPVKDPELLVEVARRVLEQRASSRFLVLGDGRMREEVEAALREAGIIDRVHLLGWQENLAVHYGLMDVLLNTSRNEGTPLAGIEAMAAGIPVVATAVGGVPDIVEDGVTGRLVADRSPEALATAVLELLASPDRRRQMGATSRERAERFSADALVDNVDRLYRLLLQEKGIA